jgi:tetratricopeptide (TPR) repeat protein
VTEGGRGWEVATVAELDRIPVAHGLEWRPVRRRFDIRAFGVNAYTAEKPGDWVVEEHVEGSGHEELYVVLAGRATFTLDGEEVDAAAGTIVFIRSSVKRVAVAEEEGTTVLAVGGWRDRAFEPSAWEWYFTAYPLADRGDLDGALAVMREALEEHPENGSVFYHLACIESRAGRLDEARQHLDQAIELRPELEQQAADDEDLAPLRI